MSGFFKKAKSVFVSGRGSVRISAGDVVINDRRIGSRNQLDQDYGSVIEREFETQLNRRLKTAGAFNVRFKQDDRAESHTIRAKGPERIVNALKVTGGTLLIDLDFYATDKPIEVEVTGPAIESFEISGSGAITADDIVVDHCSAAVRGSGDVVVSGDCKSFRCQVAGSGDIDAAGLLAESVDCQVFGSGDVDAFASQSASLSVSGSGNIMIYGNPESRNQSVSGSGNIKFR